MQCSGTHNNIKIMRIHDVSIKKEYCVCARVQSSFYIYIWFSIMRFEVCGNMTFKMF